jgi:enoyl-CoA hydratase/carnithine racemase
MSGTEIEDHAGVRIVRFNRPEKRNALRLEDVQAIRAAVSDAGTSCSCIVFTGSGGHFSAGADISRLKEQEKDQREENAALDPAAASPGQLMLDEVRTCQCPTVAAVEGYCVGIAMDLTAVCDIRVAAEDARFAMPEVKIGIPVIGDAGLFARHFGLARAKEMLLTGRWYSARQLDNWGYINQLTGPGEAEDAALAYAKEFCGLPARALAAQKRIFEAWLQLPHREAARVSMLEYAITAAHPDTRDWITRYRS